MSGPAATLRRSPLHDRHVAAGAKLVPFAGWEMPVQYAGIRAEHEAVRTGAGVFDVSHMGEVETAGPQATALLQRATTNDVARIPQGGAQYGLLCREDGGVLDDLFTYRLAERRYLTVTNAANHEADLAALRDRAAAESIDADLRDCREAFAMLAVQGPAARGIVGGLADGPLPPRFHAAERTVAGVPMLVCGTGYTGEDGVELLLDPAGAGAVWDALLSAGAVPAGLGARDTLRLEACYPLYGADLSTARTPIEAGLGWACREDTGFVGAEAVAAARAAGPAERLVPFTMTGAGIPRPGCPVVGGGEVTSGTLAPSLGIGAGLAYVPAARAAPGTEIEIDIRGRVRPAVVQRKPLYPPGDPQTDG